MSIKKEGEELGEGGGGVCRGWRRWRQMRKGGGGLRGGKRRGDIAEGVWQPRERVAGRRGSLGDRPIWKWVGSHLPCPPP